MYVTASKLLVIDPQGPLFLLVRSRRHWSLPGGKIDPDESPLHALSREVWEELGFRLDLSTIDLIGIHDLEGWSNAVFRMWSDELPEVTIGHEIVEIEWVDFSGLYEKCPYWYEFVSQMKGYERMVRPTICPKCEGKFPRNFTRKYYGVRYCEKCYTKLANDPHGIYGEDWSDEDWRISEEDASDD